MNEPMGWGKHASLTYLEAARRDPGYMQWAAKKIRGSKGRLCLEALAVSLGLLP
jgi:hypothetical protein